MSRKKLIKLELLNVRYTRKELKDHASEFIHYARYAGYVLKDFNIHLSASKLHPLKPDIAERNHRLAVETTIDNAKIIYQIIQIYPSFSSWKIKMISPNLDLAVAFKKASVAKPSDPQKPAIKAKKETVAKKKAKAKKVAKKKPAIKAKKTTKKKVAAKKKTKRR